MLGITNLKIGTKIQLDGVPYVITWNQHSKQARGGGVMKTKLKNLLTGNSLERTFQGNDKIEPAEINFRKAQFLYANEDNYEFMDQETYETVRLSKAQLGGVEKFLTDGMEVDLQYFENNPINIQLQPKMAFEVTHAEPGVKGDSAQGATKNATIETGYTLKVPLFIETGDKIIINTDFGEYVERAKN